MPSVYHRAQQNICLGRQLRGIQKLQYLVKMVGYQ
jgi:hypothetical protein